MKEMYIDNVSVIVDGKEYITGIAIVFKDEDEYKEALETAQKFNMSLENFCRMICETRFKEIMMLAEVGDYTN